jgi:hypothetical protein
MALQPRNVILLAGTPEDDRALKHPLVAAAGNLPAAAAASGLAKALMEQISARGGAFPQCWTMRKNLAEGIIPACGRHPEVGQAHE